MANRNPLLVLSMTLILLIVGCTGQTAIPTAASLPTITPIPPTDTPIPQPPTWTPQPTAALTCDQFFTRTAQSAQTVCGGLNPGEACFVSARTGLTLRPVTSAPAFAAPGDRILMTLFNRIDSTAYDPANNTWGMALLNVPTGTDGGAVAALVFGQAGVIDTDSGSGPFQSMYIYSDPAAPQCARAPLSGVLLQNSGSEAATLAINGVSVEFSGTLLVRAQVQGTMQITVITGDMLAETEDGGQEAPVGTQLLTPLGGASGFEVAGPFTLRPLDTDATSFLPLVALPRTVAVGPPALPTSQGGEGDIIALPPTRTPQPTETPLVPFVGTPPSGVYLTYGGKRITPNGEWVTGNVSGGGSDSWVFEPHGLAPDSFDSFEVTAYGGWDPVLNLESATWGPYVVDYDQSAGDSETYIGALAGSGGDWRIVIRDANGVGGAYTIRYTCQGPCLP